MKYAEPADDCIPLLLAALPYDVVANHKGHGVVFVEDAGGGTLVVETHNGETRTLTVATGEEIPVKVAKVLAGATDVVSVRVYVWGR